MIANKTRSFVKAITWRILASADTFLISYIITGKLSWAGSITLLEIITQILASRSPAFIAETMGTRSVPFVDPKTATLTPKSFSFFLHES